MGGKAGMYLTDGDNNTFIGYGAGADTANDVGAISISNSVFIGANAGRRLSGNTAGQEADNNTIIGAWAARGGHTTVVNNAGYANVVIGRDAAGSEVGTSTTWSNYNSVFIGDRAANDAATVYSSVIIGQYANSDGTNDVTGGGNNIFIGQAVRASETTPMNEIAIGQAAVAVANNTAIIGNASCTDVYMGDNGNTWSQTSDGRLKENVEDWNKGLNEINKLRVVEFNFKKDNPFKYNSDKKRQGIIAQEAQEVLPEMINDDGKWLSSNTEPMTWTLVKAVQELSSENKELKEELNELKIFIKKKLGDE